MKVAFITGITGQDGSYLAELLLEKGYIVWGIIRRSSSINTSRINHIFHNKNLILKYGDLSDGTCLLEILCEIKNKYTEMERLEVYNLGAMSHVKISFEIPEYTADIDAIGTLRLLNAIRSSGLQNITRFYQASTSEMYGKVVEVPQTEKTPFYPRSPYGVAKLYSHWITKNYREAYDMYACSGTLFNHETVAGNSPMIFKIGKYSNDIDIKPISEIVRYHTVEDTVLVNESNEVYQEGEVLMDLYVWDNNDWTKVKFASGYKHDYVNNPKYPKYINTDNSCYMATNTHNIIMDDNTEKEVQNIVIGDNVKLVDLPVNNIEFNNENMLADFECEFIGIIVRYGYIVKTNDMEIKFINIDEERMKYYVELYDIICQKYKKINKYKWRPHPKQKSARNFDIVDVNWFINIEDYYNKDNTKRIPKIILNTTYSNKMAFLKGFNLNTNIETNSPVLASGLIYLLNCTTKQKYSIDMNNINLFITINLQNNTDNNNNDNNIENVPEQPDSLNQVKNIIKQYNYNGWFYDLETETGTFYCGIGQGLVHNSPRRAHNFVTRKITIGLGKIIKGEEDKLVMGNLDAKRDWGHAKDYVKGMWLMLQQDKPDDYVLSTNEFHSVREFIEKSFALRGFEIGWKGEGLEEIGYDKKSGRELIFVSDKYFRAAGVDELLGDSTKARTELGWISEHTFNDLVNEMVDNDCPVVNLYIK